MHLIFVIIMCECFSIYLYLKVDQLQVNYSREKVYIYLHPGAIVNGQYVRIPLITCMVNISDDYLPHSLLRFSHMVHSLS